MVRLRSPLALSEVEVPKSKYYQINPNISRSSNPIQERDPACHVIAWRGIPKRLVWDLGFGHYLPRTECLFVKGVRHEVGFGSI